MFFFVSMVVKKLFICYNYFIYRKYIKKIILKTSMTLSNVTDL